MRALLADMHVLQTVKAQMVHRVVRGIACEALPTTASALLCLFSATGAVRRSTVALQIADTDAVAWDARESDGETGKAYIFRQASCLGGGSTEMQRNIISERVLGMPRESAADRGIPFKDVRQVAPATSR